MGVPVGLQDGEALYVHTPNRGGNTYYAVTCVLGGTENLTQIGPGNSLDKPVAEEPGRPLPVLQYVQEDRYKKDPVEYWYRIWTAPPLVNLPVRSLRVGIAVSDSFEGPGPFSISSISGAFNVREEIRVPRADRVTLKVERQLAWLPALFYNEGRDIPFLICISGAGKDRGHTSEFGWQDDPVWNGDSVEVFLRPDPQQPCSQFAVNPRGVIYDARDKQSSWNGTAQAKASIDVPSRADGVTRVLAGGAPRPTAPNRGQQQGGVTVYHRISFDAGAGGFQPGQRTEAAPTDDAVGGKAFRVECRESWAGCELPISIVGSRGLKVALMINGRKIESAGINVYDTIARDNTTAYGYRYFKEDWTPVVYFLDKFRYNSRDTGFVLPNTHYGSVRFYGPQQVSPGAWFAMDNFVIYRGDDRQAPEKVTGLEALATGRGVQLKWDAAEDNVAPMIYVVSRDDRGGFRKIAESYRTSYLDTAAPKGACRYRVFAIDFEENFGPWSDPAAVNSTSTPREPEHSREAADRLGYADHVRQVHARGKGKVRRNHATLFGDSLTGATVYPQCARAASSYRCLQ